MTTKAPICQTCGQPAKLSQGKFGMKAECCGLWSWNGKPLVSRETHAARIRAHEAFDRLWKSGRMTRRVAYARLADVMGMEPADCHIALMDAVDAHQVIHVVRAGKLNDDTRIAPISGARRDIWITVGADCPWNTTPGIRQTYNFSTLEAAHTAGFTSIR